MASAGTDVRYVLGRSANTNRPMCQHIVSTDYYGLDTSICGYDLKGSSRQYTDGPLLSILCNRCRKMVE